MGGPNGRSSQRTAEAADRPAEHGDQRHRRMPVPTKRLSRPGTRRVEAVCDASVAANLLMSGPIRSLLSTAALVRLDGGASRRTTTTPCFTTVPYRRSLPPSIAAAAGERPSRSSQSIAAPPLRPPLRPPSPSTVSAPRAPVRPIRRPVPSRRRASPPRACAHPRRSGGMATVRPLRMPARILSGDSAGDAGRGRDALRGHAARTNVDVTHYKVLHRPHGRRRPQIPNKGLNSDLLPL